MRSNHSVCVYMSRALVSIHEYIYRKKAGGYLLLGQENDEGGDGGGRDTQLRRRGARQCLRRCLGRVGEHLLARCHFLYVVENRVEEVRRRRVLAALQRRYHACLQLVHVSVKR